MRRFWIVACLVIALAIHFVYRNGVFAMSSTNYSINWDSVNSGGIDDSSSTNYLLRDTLGEQATGYSSSTNYEISAGYRTGDQDLTILSFQLGTQENTTQVTYSSYSSTTNQVVLSSAAGFSEGDFLGVVENTGLSQSVAFGRIRDIDGNTVTVDMWDGSPDVILASPAGGDDFVYRMNGYSVEFGTLSSSLGKTSLTGVRVTSDAQNGYTVYVSDDGNLRDGVAAFIADVSDSTVTVGAEEYGWRVFGEKSVNNSSDNPFTTSTTAIQSSAAKTLDVEGVGLVYKVSITDSTPAGNYSHIVQYTITPNY
jgi:hypothetical protein